MLLLYHYIYILCTVFKLEKIVFQVVRNLKCFPFIEKTCIHGLMQFMFKGQMYTS